MISVPGGVRVWLASGATDMRRGMNRLALQVQQALGRDPHGGDVFVFRGRRGDAGGRRGADQRRTAGLPARRHRLAPATVYLAAGSRGVAAAD